MTWKDNDDKKITGPIDRIWVSPTEEWELDHFINQYLKDNNFKVNDDNRKILEKAVNSYPGDSPIKRDHLIKYLNKKYNK